MATAHAVPMTSVRTRIGALAERLIGRLPASLNRQTATVITPVAPGSLGDQALLEGLVSGLEGSAYRHFGLVEHSAVSRWSDSAVMAGKHRRAIDLADLTRSRWRRIVVTRQLGAGERAYLVGADVLDGYYSEGIPVDASRLRRPWRPWELTCAWSGCGPRGMR